MTLPNLKNNDPYQRNNAYGNFYGGGGGAGGGGHRNAQARNQNNGQRSPGGSDSVTGMRIDGVEQRINNQEQANRGLLDQVMKLQQDVKMEVKQCNHGLMEEKTLRGRLEQNLRTNATRTNELETRVRRTEDSAKENKNSLCQLITHTKNVEKVVTTGQQEQHTKREAQAQKISELAHKVNAMAQERDEDERLNAQNREECRDVKSKLDAVSMDVKDLESAMKLQTKMYEATMSSAARSSPAGGGGSGGTEGSVSETKRAAMESKILQMHHEVLDLKSKLNHEKKEREIMETDTNVRITELIGEISDLRRIREEDSRELEKNIKSSGKVSDVEREKITMQISSVATEIKREQEHRDAKIKSTTIDKIKEMEKALENNSKDAAQKEKDYKNHFDVQIAELKSYCDDGIESMKKLFEQEQSRVTTRLKSMDTTIVRVDGGLASLRGDIDGSIGSRTKDLETRIKMVDAKTEDISDRLRIGMSNMQSAIGEVGVAARDVDIDEEDEGVGSRAPSPRRGAKPRDRGGRRDGSRRRGGGGDEVELDRRATEGVREQLMAEIKSLARELEEVKNSVRKVESSCDSRKKSEAKDRSMILGDELSQKIDRVNFAQERMKRQLEELGDKTGHSPQNIVELKERVDEVEKECNKKIDTEKDSRNDDLDAIKKELNILKGNGVGTELGDASSVSKLQNDVEEVKRELKNLEEQVEKIRETLEEKKGKSKEAKDTKEGKDGKKKDKEAKGKSK